MAVRLPRPLSHQSRPSLPGKREAPFLALSPRALLAQPAPGFVLRARYLAVRPTFGTGSQRTARIAFGVRDAENFHLLEASALHDVVRLDQYLHRTRRDLREERVRTRGEQRHDLEVRVTRDRIIALLDQRRVFIPTRVRDTAGGLGLWARATATACFQSASFEPLPTAPQ